MTDPTGRCFISYRRKRSAEVELLVLALHDVGVPTWQDITNLDAEPTEDELRRVLDDPSTASALLWITPEVVDSAVIRKVEVPMMIQRRAAGDGFFIQPVAAGGLDYDSATTIAGEHLGVDNFASWNLEKVDADPIVAADAAHIAELVLRRRLKEIGDRLPAGDPVRLTLHTRSSAPFVAGNAVALDWYDRFDGRLASVETWDDRLLPAATVVAASIRELAPGRSVDASGLLALPAAVALGAAFLAPGGVGLGWRQQKTGRSDQIWSLSAERESAPVEIDEISGDPNSQDMSVVASINHDAEEALRRSEPEVPRFRGCVRLRGPEGQPADFATPGQAADAALRLIEAIGSARRRWRDIRRIHLFIAGPAGFAVLVGQLLNGLGPIQTYEHVQSDAVGSYRRAALLHPGA
jgi:SMODS-associated and fused to various effectors sensor domain